MAATSDTSATPEVCADTRTATARAPDGIEASR